MVPFKEISEIFNITLQSRPGDYYPVKDIPLYAPNKWTPYVIYGYKKADYNYMKHVVFQFMEVKDISPRFMVADRVKSLTIKPNRKICLLLGDRFNYRYEINNLAVVFKSYEECLTYIIDHILMNNDIRSLNNCMRAHIESMYNCLNATLLMTRIYYNKHLLN